MAISYNTGTTVTATAVAHTASQAVTVPAGVLAGDTVVVSISVFTFTPTGADFTLSSAAGHTWAAVAPGLVNSGTSGGLNLFSRIWTRVATAGDPGDTLTLAFTGTQGSTDQFWWSICLDAWTGAAGTDVVATPVAGAAAGSASPVMPSVTTAAAGDWKLNVLAVGVDTGGTVGTPPSGTTLRHNANTAGIVCATADSAASVGAAGTSIGGGSFSTSATVSWWAGWTIGLLDAANVPAAGAPAAAAPPAPPGWRSPGGQLRYRAARAAPVAAPPTPGLVTAEFAGAQATAPAPAAAVTVTAGVAAVAASAGGPTGASTLTMKLASTDGTTHVETWTSSSPMNSGGNHAVRILRPTAADPSMPHAMLYCLPVSTEGDASFGSALDILQAAGYHNKYNVTLVEPTFGASPWYADNPLDATLRHESLTIAVVNWCIQHIAATTGVPAVQGNEAQHLIGFSKSGLGGFDLLMNHPALFGKAAVWDTPFDMTAYDRFSPDSSGAYGTQASFAATYETSSANVSARKAPLQTAVKRLWMGNGVLYATEMANFDTLLTGQSVPHSYASSNNGNGSHVFDSSWVLPGADAILGATGDPAAAAVANQPVPAVQALAAVAAVSAASNAASVSTGGVTNAPAGVAAVSAVALAPVAALTAAPPAAPVVAAAAAPVPANSALPAVSIIGATAPGASVNTSGSASAHPAAAASAAAAAPPVPAVTVTAGVAACAAAAMQPVAGSGVQATPAVAGALVRALPPSLVIAANAVAAQILAVAPPLPLAGTHNATSSPAVSQSMTSAPAVTATATSSPAVSDG